MKRENDNEGGEDVASRAAHMLARQLPSAMSEHLRRSGSSQGGGPAEDWQSELEERGVSYAHCIEKSELIGLLLFSHENR